MVVVVVAAVVAVVAVVVVVVVALKTQRFACRTDVGYCALCSQWIACASKVKQHYRLSHQQDHERYMLPASRLCSKFNTPGSPCEHCGATIQASRQHPAKCTVLWQISLMHLKLQADRNGAGTATGSLRPLGDGAAELNGVGADEKGSRAQLGPFRSQQGLANGAGQGAPVAAGPHKQTTLAQRWGKGTPFRWPQSDLSDQGVGQAGATTGDGAQDPQTGVLFVQPDNQGPLPLLFAAAQKWKKSQEEGATTTALRTTLFGCLIQMLHTGLKDIGGAAPTPFQTKAEEMKWLKDGSWCYQKWSPALGSLVIDEDRPPLQHAKLVEALQLVLPIIL